VLLTVPAQAEATQDSAAAAGAEAAGGGNAAAGASPNAATAGKGQPKQLPSSPSALPTQALHGQTGAGDADGSSKSVSSSGEKPLLPPHAVFAYVSRRLREMGRERKAALFDEFLPSVLPKLQMSKEEVQQMREERAGHTTLATVPQGSKQAAAARASPTAAMSTPGGTFKTLPSPVGAARKVLQGGGLTPLTAGPSGQQQQQTAAAGAAAAKRQGSSGNKAEGATAAPVGSTASAFAQQPGSADKPKVGAVAEPKQPATSAAPVADAAAASAADSSKTHAGDAAKQQPAPQPASQS